MDGLNSDEKIEAGKEVEYAIDPNRPQNLRRSGAGEGTSVVGSATPNTSVTAPFFSHRAQSQEGTAATVAADRGRNRRDASLMHARLPHVTS
jgi:hypothetical protein